MAGVFVLRRVALGGPVVLLSALAWVVVGTDVVCRDQGVVDHVIM